MRIAVVVLCGVFMFGVSTVHGSDWQKYNLIEYTKKTGEHVTQKEYYDKESIVRTKKGTIKVWTKANHDGDTEDTPYIYKTLMEIDCSERTMKILSLTRYYKNNKIEEDESLKGTVEEVEPDTNREKLFKTVCTYQRKK